MITSSEYYQRNVQELQQEYDLISDKIMRLRRAHALETNVAARMQLEDQIRQAETEREKIVEQIGAVSTEWEKSQQQSGKGAPPYQLGRILHNLPQPDYPRFIGRQTEKARILEKLLFSSSLPVISIEGIAGAGKTSLALEVAHVLLQNNNGVPEEKRFTAIVWVSAKPSMLTTDGVFRRKLPLQTLDEICSVIAFTLEAPSLSIAGYQQKVLAVRHLMSKHRVLLVIDNFESIQDEDIVAFLGSLPAPTKALITTRRAIDIGYPIHLDQMSPQDGIKLIKEHCELHHVSLSREEIKQLYDGTSGIPLAIVWCVANMAFGLSIKSALKGLKQRKSDVAEFLFRGTMNSIHGKDSYYALLSLVLFAGDATRNAWEYVFGGEDSTQRDLAIMELTKLCLIHITQNRYSLLPLVQDALVDEIQSQEEFRKQAIQRFVEYYCNYMKEHDTQRGSLKKDAQTATREVKNLIAASRYAYDHGMMEQAIELVDGLTSILWPLGLWNEWLEVLDLGVYACRSSNNPQKEAWFRKDKGWIYVERGEMSSAQREAEAALALIDKSEPSETHIACLRILASVERANGNTDAARKYFDQAIDLLERTNNPRKLASTLANVAAMLLESEGASEQAMSVLVRSQNILEPLGDSWRLARIQYLIGEWYWIKNDVNAAKRFYELARKANEAIGIKRNDILIDICLGEAKLFLANGEYEAALARLRAVEPLLDAHGLSRKNKYQQLLDKIEKAWRVQ